MTEFWDRIGISASLLCAIHCLLTPFLIILVPFLGNLLADQWIHIAIAVVIFPVAAWALWSGYRRHRHPYVLILGTLGLVLMAIGMSYGNVQIDGREELIQIIFMVAAGVILAGAHFLNLRECRKCH